MRVENLIALEVGAQVHYGGSALNPAREEI
jgi:hypothetical protein